MSRNLSNILAIIIFISCVSMEAPPPLNKRTLLIDEQSSALIYPYNYKKCKTCDIEREVLKFDLTNKEIRQKLIDIGFECRVKEKY